MSTRPTSGPVLVPPSEPSRPSAPGVVQTPSLPPTPSRRDPLGGRFARWAGTLLVVPTAAALLALEAVGLRIPNPVLILAVAIVLAAYLGGVVSGLLSVAVSFAYTLVTWSLPGQLFHYSSGDVRRLVVQAVTMPTMAILVGVLHARSERRLRQLADSLAQVKQLEGLIPICMYCKKIRKDGGYWERIEAYLGARSKATFTHGICPDCEGKLTC